MATFSDVFDAAQALPTTDRGRLIEALWNGLSPAEWPAPSEEWLVEAQRRSAAYDAGVLVASPWSEVVASPWSEVRPRARMLTPID